jgi:hypothetical protein
MRPTGFYDYFFPAENFDIKSLSDSNRNIIFKNGIRVDFFQGRRSLKKEPFLYQQLIHPIVIGMKDFM